MRRVAFAGRIAFALLLAGCGHEPQVVRVEIKGIAYQPAHVQVHAGDTLVFTNHDFVPHTVTARDKSWDSGSLAANAVWKLVARRSTEFYCTYHPNMVGHISVQ